MTTPFAPIVLPGGRICLGSGNRPVIADASGQALCVCPAGTNCIPVNNPSCLCGAGCFGRQSNSGSGSYVRNTSGNIAESPVWSATELCCCPLALDQSGVGYYLSELVTDGVVVFRIEANGSWAAGQSTYPAVLTARGSSYPNGTVTFNYTATNGQSCLPPTSVTIPPGFPFCSDQGGAVFGTWFRDCGSRFSDLTTYSPDGRSRCRTVGWTRISHASCTTNCAPKGACCCGGRCFQDLTAGVCAAMGGQYKGDGSRCLTTSCSNGGACCLEDGTCQQTKPEACAILGGVYLGDGVLCGSGARCPTTASTPLACCFTSGPCQNLTRAACLAQGGTPSSSLTCAQVTCPTSNPGGACCKVDGTCQQTNLSTCNELGGYFREGLTCSESACQGACCHATSHGGCVCSVENIFSCLVLAGCNGVGAGTFQGFQTTCSPDPCSAGTGFVGGGGGWLPMFDHGARYSRSRSQVFGGFRGGCGSCGSSLFIPSPSQVARVRETRNRG